MSQEEEQKIKEIEGIIKRLERAQADFVVEFEKARAQFGSAYEKLRGIIDSAKAEKIKQELSK